MKYKISALQLFAVMTFSLMGSAVLFLLGGTLRQDAWLVLIFGIPVGIVEVIIYTSLFYEYPDDTLVGYMIKIFGKGLGSIICVLYILRFFYNGARILREFGELTLVTVSPRASLYVITLIITVVVTYSVYSGIENICRLAQITLPIYLCIFLIEYILLFMTEGAVDLNNILPFFESGIKPILMEIFPLGVEFPFGVSIIFTMIFPFVNKPEKVRTTTIYAIIFIGIILAFNTIMIISTLGVDFALSSLFPLLEAMRFVKVGFIDRIDILTILAFMLGLFFKITLHLYAAMLGTAQLLKVKNTNVKWLSIPFGILIFIASIIIAEDYPQHLHIGMNVTPWIFFNLFIIFPILALIIHFLKRGKSKTRK
ncbi:GerAB/ArcD/ProY family transporter [Abyssisolibacter fermentans]|uniref:GerAB/ArcD/ProY family transporter n=1 Tax=Abyssisolibacter fermentans TaxID=1766203 RepID=UPI0008359E84|nr:GerAB/ArcD/ProY family transporter [Abyssisolibacter fermentans]